MIIIIIKNYGTVFIKFLLLPHSICYNRKSFLGFPGGAVVKNPPANAGDMGSSPGLGRSQMPWSN